MKTKTKHTPGPWIVKHLRDKGINAEGRHYEILHPIINETGEYAGENGGYNIVIGDKNCEPGYILSEADANFIAAAPETVAERDRLREINVELIAALEGLFEHCAMIHKHWGDKGNSQAADAAQNAARAAIAKAEGKEKQ